MFLKVIFLFSYCVDGNAGGMPNGGGMPNAGGNAGGNAGKGNEI